MNIHEYQAKELLKGYGVAVPQGTPIFDVENVKSAAETLIKQTGIETVVVKSQIHAGGRGKGRFKEATDLGGVNVVKGAVAATDVAKKMFGNTLVTHQTGEEGKVVGRLLVEQGIDIDREVYIGAVLDRDSERIVLMGCAEGGMEIETIAADSPEKIFKEYVDPVIGLSAYQARRMAFKLGISDKEALKSATTFFTALVKAFDAEDASIVEINPLVITKQGEVMALDAKINFDDNAKYRHPGWSELQDDSEEEASELEAKKYDLSYVKLDGTIGCMVNGAGLAMATMDIIKASGAEPANFLDVGGGANKERVSAAFKIIVSDPNVKAILINIFGGIVQCDVLAQGVVDAAKEVNLSIPLVVRLEGTNVDQGRKILADSGLKITSATDMADAAHKAVSAANAAEATS